MLQSLTRRIWLPLRRRVAPLHTTHIGENAYTYDLRDHVMSYILFTEGEYEAHLLKMLRSLPLAGGLAFDVGGNFGLYAVALGRAVGPGGRVFSFEPEPRNFELLTRNLRQNNLTWVEPIRAAVGAKAGEIRMNISEDNFGDHFASESGTGPSVPLVTLDQFRAERAAGSAVKFVKIDVQGFELAVLEGAERTLTESPDTFVQIEIQPALLKRQDTTAAAVVQWLYDRGYHGAEIHPNRIAPMGKAWEYDLILDHSAVDCLLCRDANLLRTSLANALGCNIPADF